LAFFIRGRKNKVKKIRCSTYIVLVLILFLGGCGADNRNKTIDDLIDYFKQNEIAGVRKEKIFAVIGAIDGCAYRGDNFSIEIYKFNDKDKFENFPEMTFKNGYFVMLIHKPKEGNLREKIVKLFRDF
jgi:hypothetical protein